MIIGTGERRWTAFCFSDTYYDPEWEPCEDEMSNQMFTCDPIASYTGAIDANLPIWNAREYFLVAICNRMECISEQWRTIGRIVEIGVNKLKVSAIHPNHQEPFSD